MRDGLARWLVCGLLLCGGCASGDWLLLAPRLTISAGGTATTVRHQPAVGQLWRRQAGLYWAVTLAWSAGARLAAELRNRRAWLRQLGRARSRVLADCAGWLRLLRAGDPPDWRRQLLRLCLELVPVVNQTNE